MERVRLTLKQKNEIIEHKSANPHISRAQLQAWAMQTFNLASAPSKSALTDILHGRAVQHDGNFDDSRKSMHLAKCPVLEAKLIAWINACENLSLPIVTQSVLREKAKQLADEDQDQIMAISNGWIEKFQQRHGLKSRRVYGEAGSVDPATIEEGKPLLQKVTVNYSKEDIYNMDETAYFYCAQAKKSISKQRQAGRKVVKKRIIVAITTNATGEARPPLLFIGHSHRPRCFGGRSCADLDIKYAQSKKGWMNTSIFRAW
ncbi:hypothetical protein AeMF1_020617 [Aphanomyces euteiches]|nr:hypothetical protein AeMF1_020617 [Aphanomyces euteiches]